MMPKLALFVRLEAKPGKEAEVVKFLETGLALARQEPTTPIWFALRLSPSSLAFSTHSTSRPIASDICSGRSPRP
jgi:hypothetical protein